MAARCACGLEVVIRTSWTNRNPGRRFYGCPTLSPTCVDFLRWYDPPMCQWSIQIIPWLLRGAIIEELERLPRNLVACKTREHLKRIQKAVFVEVIELKKELRLQVPPQGGLFLKNSVNRRWSACGVVIFGFWFIYR
ncbi:zinc finger, GRF-type containing protein [Tanacetum coccineum]